MAALLIADFDVLGTDSLSLLQMVISGPADHRAAVFRFTTGETDPAFLRHIQLASQSPVPGSTVGQKIGTDVFRWDRDGSCQLTVGSRQFFNHVPQSCLFLVLRGLFQLTT